MKQVVWDSQKNQELKRNRGVSFEEVLVLLEKGAVLDIYENPKQEKYKGQKIYVVNIRDYAYLVPCEETETELILKTVIPSRKASKKYLERRVL